MGPLFVGKRGVELSSADRIQVHAEAESAVK